jgi:hypothetical protein
MNNATKINCDDLNILMYFNYASVENKISIMVSPYKTSP